MSARTVHRPDRQGLREGEHLHRTQRVLREIEGLEFLRGAEEKGNKWDPPSLFKTVQTVAVKEMARERHMRTFAEAVRGRGGLVTALIFDCDGVLADTERYGHLPAFNATFDEYGLPAQWDEVEYARAVEDRRRKGAVGGAVHPDDLSRPPGFPTIPMGRSCWPTGASAEPRAPERWSRAGKLPGAARASGGSSPGRWMPAQDAGGRLDVGRGIGTRHSRARDGPEAHAERFVSPVTSCRRRSRTRRSTGSRSSGLGLDPNDALVIEDSRNGLFAAFAAGLRASSR